MLINNHADPDLEDIDHKPALYYALKFGNFEVAQIILENFGNPWSPNGIKYLEMIE